MMNTISYWVGLILAWLAVATGSLGNAIVVFSILLKTLLLPLSVSSQKQMDRMRKMQPKLKELKQTHKNDPQAFNKAQMDLMKEHQVNPIGGCIPQLVQFGILIVLYQVFVQVFKTGQINGQAFDTHYIWFDLTQSDPTYILPILAGVLQFILSVMMLQPETKPESTTEPAKSKKGKKKSTALAATEKTDKQESMEDFSVSMQKQMVFMLPVMTTLSFVFLKLPSGLALYWVVTSAYSIVQQYFTSGLGMLPEYWRKVPVLGKLGTIKTSTQQ